MITGWTALIVAGIFEVGFTTLLKLTDGFTKYFYIALFMISAILSFYFLTQAMKTIPLGTAYAVWTGIGAFGTVLVGIFFYKDPASLWRIFFLTILIGSIIGLKIVSKGA